MAENNWETATWGELATLEYGKSLRGYESLDGPYRVFGTNGPIGWHDEVLCGQPSVVIGRKGAYRGVHYSANPFFVIDTAFYLKPKVEMDTLWAYYELLVQDINGLDSGSAIPSTRREDFYSLTVQVPPLAEQRAIAQVLGTLDDKIDLNWRMIQTLEAMAQALFKSWFVDFDPVHAKATLKQRDTTPSQGGSDWSVERVRAYLDRMDPNIASLFPDSFVNSELGPIPEGWEVGHFGEVVEQERDNENPLASPDAIFHHFSIPAFDENQCPTAERGENIKSQKSRVLPGVVLLSKLNPEIERVWLVDVGASDRAVCSTEFLVLRPRPPYGRSFAYCLGCSPAFRQELGSLVTGTSKSHQRVQANAVFALPVVLFPKPISEAFERKLSVVLQMTQARRRESRTLATLRDALLPKLVSGEMRVERVLHAN